MVKIVSVNYRKLARRFVGCQNTDILQYSIIQYDTLEILTPFLVKIVSLVKIVNLVKIVSVNYRKLAQDAAVGCRSYVGCQNFQCIILYYTILQYICILTPYYGACLSITVLEQDAQL